APRSPPDQKRCSNSSASRCACFRPAHLRKIIVHETTDAASSRSITAFTSGLAPMTKCIMERSVGILKLRNHHSGDPRRQRARTEIIGVEAGNTHSARTEGLGLNPVPIDGLFERQAGPATLDR